MITLINIIDDIHILIHLQVRQRLEEVRTSPHRVQIVCDSLAERESEATPGSPPKTPKSSRTTRAAIKRSTPHPNQGLTLPDTITCCTLMDPLLSLF